MYNKNGEYIVAKIFYQIKFSFKEKIIAFKRENNFGRWLWLIHPLDNYGQHLERYYNNPRIKKKILNLKRGKYNG